MPVGADVHPAKKVFATKSKIIRKEKHIRECAGYDHEPDFYERKAYR